MGQEYVNVYLFMGYVSTAGEIACLNIRLVCLLLKLSSYSCCSQNLSKGKKKLKELQKTNLMKIVFLLST